MTSTPGATTAGLALVCDGAGVVRRVACDGVTSSGVVPGTLFADVVDIGSAAKARLFLAQARTDGAAFGWELTVATRAGLEPLPFLAVAEGDTVIVVGAATPDAASACATQLTEISNKLAVALRAALQNHARFEREQEAREAAAWNEIGRLNNELTTVQRELARRNAELARINEEKNRVLGMAAHDLRTPLSSIYGFAHFLLEDRALNERQHDFVEVIARNASSMLRLVSDLLDIATIEAGRVRLDRTKVDVAVLVERTAELLRPLAERHGVSVQARRRGVDWTARVDEGKVEQVVMNLATNALKFSPTGGSVDMTVRDEGATVAIEVQDQGPGIPREELGKLFAPFGRTSVRPTRDVKGTGLGLAIVHRIVVAHGGRIEIESSSDAGSLFRVVLPRTRGPREQA